MDASDLAPFDLFASLDEEQRAAVAARFGEERLPAGAKIFAEGEPGDRMYLVSGGTVRISKVIHGTGEEALAMLRRGDYFGEMSLIDDHPRSAEAVADEDVVAFSLSREQFRELIEADARVAVAVLTALAKTLSVRLRETNEQVKAMHLMAMW